MRLFERLTQRIVFRDEDEHAHDAPPSRYRRMWRNTVLSVVTVAVVPLVIMTMVNFYLYERSFKEEISHPIQRIASVTTHAIESFLAERIAAARYVLSREHLDDLTNQERLEEFFRRMRASFGGIVDIGIVDQTGTMITYAGPYNLQNKNYSDQDWFNKAFVRDTYVSDVFLGHRNIPHFIIAVKRESERGEVFIFRATIDTEVLTDLIQVSGLKNSSDAFIVNREGILQTPSRFFGETLKPFPVEIPSPGKGTEIIHDMSINGSSYVFGYCAIEESPFLFVILADRSDLMRAWFTVESEILLFMLGSLLALTVLIMGISSNWVRRIKNADLRRQAAIHKAEHSNKMASIGRLAAGVAHEINNPLAIINEKAGLMKDIIDHSEAAPPKEKLLKQVDKIIASVERCSSITHRLLGFARHIDVTREPVAVLPLIQDVLSFLEKEAVFRDIRITVNKPDTLPTIESDKGQLQQLFLNIINNAFDAMKKGGHLEITIEDHSPASVVVRVKDDGMGIPRQDLERIFEPFYTTKGSKGTGLGLSICYGIVKKLKGTLAVDSRVGEGTCFAITLPVSLDK